MMLRRRVLERTSKEGKRPVSEKLNRLADTRVPQDTRNPVGSRRDHPPRLNTIQSPIAHSTVRER